ncbi:hypothetical protein [Streptomyces sp. ICBB 8177]|uniref:hypothetical protein n=1 Tax=Streptomyces sp. ICBB 8177 TaxID=563922 RepID=UPI001F542F83|nr:hypothetical protein [Streptomyces sp. ICBB 8177]
MAAKTSALIRPLGLLASHHDVRYDRDHGVHTTTRSAKPGQSFPWRRDAQPIASTPAAIRTAPQPVIGIARRRSCTPTTAGSGWQKRAERDPARYRGEDDAYDCLMLELVLSAIVLGEPARELRTKLVELTRRNTGNAEVPAGIVQHNALGLRSDS